MNARALRLNTNKNAYLAEQNPCEERPSITLSARFRPESVNTTRFSRPRTTEHRDTEKFIWLGLGGSVPRVPSFVALLRAPGIPTNQAGAWRRPEREHAPPVQDFQPREDRQRADDLEGERDVLVIAEDRRPGFEHQLEHSRIRDGDHEGGDLVPPGDVERVLKRAGDKEVQARGEVDRKSDLGQRQELGGLPDWNPLHEPEQASVEEPRGANHQRESQE